MAKRRFLVTSGLPYSNGLLHVGHVAGAYLPADTYVRYLRARGDEVLFICGSDDNGVAALISADAWEMKLLAGHWEGVASNRCSVGDGRKVRVGYFRPSLSEVS